MRLKGAAAREKLDQSRRAFAEAIAIDRSLIRENPRLDAYRFDYLTVLLIAATVEAASGRSREGLAMLQEAREVHAEIAISGGDMSFLKPTLVAILAGTAQAHSEQGRADEALEVLDEADRLIAAPLAERTSSGGPRPAGYRGCLYPGRNPRRSEASGRSRRRLGPRHGPGADRFASARRLIPRDAARRSSGRAQARSAPALAVVPLAGAVCGSAPMSGVTLVSYARLYALAAAAAVDQTDRESFEARALFCLEKAWDAGYFRQPGRLERVESDPVFFHLRARRDFRAFLRIARK